MEVGSISLKYKSLSQNFAHSYLNQQLHYRSDTLQFCKTCKFSLVTPILLFYYQNEGNKQKQGQVSLTELNQGCKANCRRDLRQNDSSFRLKQKNDL